MGAALPLTLDQVRKDANAIIAWEPTPRQADFLACDEFEVLYGGAAGGGKSDALLVDALCLQAGGIANPKHRAVLFRRSFPELRDLIDRSREIYKAVCPTAKYDGNERIWTFPNVHNPGHPGAKVEFGYLQHDNDRFKYRGRAWNYVGFDELTLWPTDICYKYLFSRCRSTDPSLPRYIRAATNPDGPGQKWVMDRWGISEDGLATYVPLDIVDEEMGVITHMFRRFVPAKLSDNVHLSGTGYREALLQMSREEIEALLGGKWRGNLVKGAYYSKEMAYLRSNGRIRSVPHTTGVPVNTFWDLGYNDTTAIWFHQEVAREHRFIAAYENSGEDLAHYVRYMQEQGYVFGVHYLPHDAENATLQTGKSTKLMLEELMPSQRFETVPRVQNIAFGIHETRLKMKGPVFIDADKCGDGIVALDSYRKTYNSKLDVYTEQPLHDRYSNYADAFRQWAQGYSIGLSRGSPRQQIKHSRRPSGMAA